MQLHRMKTLSEINQKFEHDIYEFLFKESGYNKKRLSRSLDICYSVVLQKTKPLTEVSESFSKSE